MPTHYEGTTEEKLALTTFIKLTRAVESVQSRLNEQNTMCGLTISQFGTLESLYHLGSMCPSEISQKLLKSGGNMTLVLDNLAKQDLIQRQRDLNDRRMVIISLTDKGRDLIERIFPNHAEAIVKEFACLSTEEQHMLGYLCRKLGQGCE
jgi:MarR family 2-MHQ and catechol resistance regulon transcriptional repressor